MNEKIFISIFYLMTFVVLTISLINLTTISNHHDYATIALLEKNTEIGTLKSTYNSQPVIRFNEENFKKEFIKQSLENLNLKIKDINYSFYFYYGQTNGCQIKVEYQSIQNKKITKIKNYELKREER